MRPVAFQLAVHTDISENGHGPSHLLIQSMDDRHRAPTCWPDVGLYRMVEGDRLFMGQSAP